MLSSVSVPSTVDVEHFVRLGGRLRPARPYLEVEVTPGTLHWRVCSMASALLVERTMATRMAGQLVRALDERLDLSPVSRGRCRLGADIELDFDGGSTRRDAPYVLDLMPHGRDQRYQVALTKRELIALRNFLAPHGSSAV